MRLIRFEKENKLRYGILNNGMISEIESFSTLKPIDGELIKVGDVKIVLPVDPQKILCVGLNYKSHADEMGEATMSEPVIFMKPKTALVKSGESIIYPRVSKRVDFEGELGVVIKKTGKNIKREEVKDYILGYFCANDVTARDLQPKDGQWIMAKGFDTFLPCGEWIETDADISKAVVTTKLNGEIKQQAPCSDMIFSVEDIIIYCSERMTLEEGDIIITGTPSGIGPMQVGDVVSIEIEGVGICSNTIICE